MDDSLIAGCKRSKGDMIRKFLWNMSECIWCMVNISHSGCKLPCSQCQPQTNSTDSCLPLCLLFTHSAAQQTRSCCRELVSPASCPNKCYIARAYVMNRSKCLAHPLSRPVACYHRFHASRGATEAPVCSLRPKNLWIQQWGGLGAEE